ncbi:MAG: 3-deoxy-D-manno-octulosonic acid transferase [Roseococcus sp.]
MRLSPALLAWHHLAGLLAPGLRWNLRRRVARGKEESARLPEREGHGADRPKGRLIWLHAASVGESLAILPLLEALAERDPALNMLVTTGTVTSARLLPQRLSAALRGRVTHRYAPLDVPAWVERFLDGWRPDAAAFVESELWPNTLAAAAGRGIPLALLNARISDRTARRWERWAPGFARELLGRFRVIMPRSAEDEARLLALGARAVTTPGDLKLAAPPLPVEEGALAALRSAIGGRPVLLAASTHPGEEAQILAVAETLRQARPELLTILAPRHPERGAELGAAPRRGLGALPDAGPTYIADTMGEMGLLYRVADLAVIGGSLVPHGGQNPLEAARLGCPMVFGPHMQNFREATAGLLAAGGARQVADTAALAATVADMLTNPHEAATMARAAGDWVAAGSGLPGRMAEALLALTGPEGASGQSWAQVQGRKV